MSFAARGKARERGRWRRAVGERWGLLPSRPSPLYRTGAQAELLLLLLLLLSVIANRK
jgi:hypothetical protein